MVTPDPHPARPPPEAAAAGDVEARKPTTQLSLGETLWAEHDTIWGAHPGTGTNRTEESYRDAMLGRDTGQAALCLSGGGIRSAAFALGILQGLARRGVLTRFHYLSTVSGGGYIGGWLSRWINEAGAAPVQDALARSILPGAAPSGMRPSGMAPSGAAPDGHGAAPGPGKPDGPTPPFGEPPQIRLLRERSNFLTPRTGFASLDTWTALSIFWRNLELNWLVLLPALTLLCAAFNLYADAYVLLANGHHAAVWSYASAAGLSVLLAYAVYAANRSLPTHARDRDQRAYVGPATIRHHVVIPSLAWCCLLPFVLAPALGAPEPDVGGVVTWTAGIACAATLGGYLAAWATLRPTWQYRRNIVVWVAASLASAAFLALGIWLGGRLLQLEWEIRTGWRLGLFLALAPSWVTLSHVGLSTVYAGFRYVPEAGGDGPRDGSATVTPDLDREWLARLSAAKLQPPALLGVLAIACLVLPFLVFDQFATTWAWLAGIVGSGTVAVVGGRSALSGIMAAVRSPGQDKSFRLPVGVAVSVATFLFIALLLLGLARAEQVAAQALARSLGGWTEAGDAAVVVAHLAVGLLLATLLALTSSRIKINRFSLHALYRNRLVRAFLGAARTRRDQDDFTALDPSDNIRLCQLMPRRTDGAPASLFHVVNMALNVTGGDRLAWQERKAISFTASPVACGWSDPNTAPDGGARRGGYVRTEDYAGVERDAGMVGAGISLGTAMTISGAAASPNMGYHTSPATAFLMTMFNVRLGAWLPNPGAVPFDGAYMRRSSPRNALMPLLRELTGWAAAGKKDVYLSDGGHFDNLGLYEMVRRRCRLIVVSDAGCDPDNQFADLGMAIRKISMDLDTRIEMGPIAIAPRSRADARSVMHALGTITYPEPGAPLGRLIYLKPGYFAANVPLDVRAYAEAHPSFPHESTGDQFFSESQFESYRRLGEAAIAELRGGGLAPHPSLPAFFDAVFATGPRAA